MLEKLYMWGFGWVLSWVDVRLASSRAKIRPRAVTKRAESFRRGLIVMICVFVGGRLEVIIRPAMILP